MDRALNHRQNISTLLRVGHIFGVVPFIDWSHPPHHTLPSWKDRLHRRLHQICVGLYIAVLVVSFWNETFKQAFNIPLTERVIFVCRFCMYLCNSLVVIIGGQWQHRKYAYFVRRFAHFDGHLLNRVGLADDANDDDNDRNRRLRENESRWLRRFINTMLVILFVATVIAGLTHYLAYNRTTLGKWLYGLYLYMFTNIMICIGLLQLFVGWRMLRARYAAVNALLERTLSGENDGTSRRQMVADLKRLRWMHMWLMRLNERLTGAFKWLIVGLTVGSVLDLTIQLYSMYHYLVRAPETIYNRVRSLYTIGWLVMHVAKLVLAMWFNDTTEVERTRYARIINEAIMRRSINCRNAFDAQLSKMQLQNLHDRDPLLACGIVPMDLSMVSSMFGRITGLLVILIQFESSQKT